MAEGEAAGTAAALAVRAGIPAVEFPAEQLRSVLQKNGAILSPGASGSENRMGTMPERIDFGKQKNILI